MVKCVPDMVFKVYVLCILADRLVETLFELRTGNACMELTKIVVRFFGIVYNLYYNCVTIVLQLYTIVVRIVYAYDSYP